MKTLSVTISEYEWNIIPFPNIPNKFILNCVDPRDGEVMFVIPDLDMPTLEDSEKKCILNVFLTGYYKGLRVGADKKAREIRRVLNLMD